MGFFSSVGKVFKKVTKGVGRALGAVGSIAGPLIGGWFGGPTGAAIGAGIGNYLGAAQQNDANSAQAARQMGFQERMSSTAWQRGMADMRAAGMNPIFAYKAGGASTPNGAMAVMQNEAAAGIDGFSQAANSAIALRHQQAQLNQIKAQTTTIGSQGHTLVAQANQAASVAAQNKQQTELIKQHTAMAKMQRQVTAKGLDLALSKEAFAADNKDWMKYERILNGIGQLFGMGNSAANTYQMMK